MKKKNRSFLLLSALGILAYAALGFAQTPTFTFTPAPPVNDVVDFQDTTATTVSVELEENGSTIQIPLQTYLEGVLSGELKDGATSNRKNACTALAIAASSKWNAAYTQDPTAVVVDTKAFQVYDNSYDRSNPTINAAVVAAGTKS